MKLAAHVNYSLSKESQFTLHYYQGALASAQAKCEELEKVLNLPPDRNPIRHSLEQFRDLLERLEVTDWHSWDEGAR